jgi:hypothetical protein
MPGRYAALLPNVNDFSSRSIPLSVSGDGALRRPRRVPRRNILYDSHLLAYSFSPRNAGWDGAARHPYQHETPNFFPRK